MVTSKTNLTGPQRVAAFLLNQDRETAAKVLKHMPVEVVAEVAQAMAALEESAAEPETIRSIYKVLSQRLNGKRSMRSGNTEELAQVLEESVDRKQADRILEEIRQRRVLERPFLEIEIAPPERLASALREESAGVCAIVLAHLDPVQSAGVLSLVESERALSIVRGMANLTPPGFEILRSICLELSERMAEQGADPGDTLHGNQLKTIAEMLNYTAGDIERAVLEGLQADGESVVGEIREHMFTWEDIGTVDRRAMQKILGTVDTKTLSLALKASSNEVETNIMSNLSSRVADMVREEREIMGSVAMAEVQGAREEIMVNVRALIDSGEFAPSKAGEELVE